MTKRTLTQSEALAILANEDAIDLPFLVLNESGKAAVREWVNATSKTPGTHNMDAWWAQAESAANDAHPDESIIIEMGSQHTADHTPRTNNLDRRAFDYAIND